MQEFLHNLFHILEHPFIETLKMAPVLYLAYLFMEWLEKAEGSKIATSFKKAKRTGPLFGAAVGIVPQCGFSGAIASMYAAGAVTAGTLIAVMLSTSDEMLPILISSKLMPLSIILILALKFLIAVIVGFLVDFILKHKNAQTDSDIHDFCTREHCSCKDSIFLAALKHTLKIIVIIFIVSVLLHIAVDLIPEQTIKTILNFPILSQFIASVLGLIPSCAVSVLFTSLYVDGALGLGPMLCGLLTNGGVGLLVLYRVNKSRKDSLFITLALLISGFVFGTVTGFIFEGIL